MSLFFSEFSSTSTFLHLYLAISQRFFFGKYLFLPAAGFANGEEAVNMSAVLTGMGAIPKSSDTTRSRPVLA